MTDGGFRFDYALSFAGSDRNIAEQLRDMLREAGFSIFYDHNYEHEMAGWNALDYLHRVYSRESRYCVILISSDYDKGSLTALERETVMARELRGEQGVLIPVIVDGHRPEWLPESRIYFDLDKRTLPELLDLLLKLSERRHLEKRSHNDESTAQQTDNFFCRFSDVSEIDEINQGILSQIAEIGTRELYEFNIAKVIQTHFEINPSGIHC